MLKSPRPKGDWIFNGQMRAQATACMGDPNLTTPNLDRLSAWIANPKDEFILPDH